MPKITGFSLIEILISLLLLSIILLGIDALQIFALHATQNNYYLSAARLQMQNMREILLAYKNIDPVLTEKWNQQNQKMLPQGKGSISGTYPLFRVSITWANTKNKIGQVECLNSEVLV